MRFELKEEGREEKPRRKRNNELQAGRKGWAAKGFNEDERDKPTSGSVSLPIHPPSPPFFLSHLSFTPLFLIYLLSSRDLPLLLSSAFSHSS